MDNKSEKHAEVAGLPSGTKGRGLNLPVYPVPNYFGYIFDQSSEHTKKDQPTILLTLHMKNPVISSSIITFEKVRDPEFVVDRYVRVAALPDELRKVVEVAVEERLATDAKRAQSAIMGVQDGSDDGNTEG
mgnify:CR=1 FL=1